MRRSILLLCATLAACSPAPNAAPGDAAALAPAESPGHTPGDSAARPMAAPVATAAQLVVVELYQSQGCSSCPPANVNVNALAARDDVLALSFAVTYWDDLGWPDRFAQTAFTQRQWDYARAAGRDHVATPQTVINGGPVTITGRRQPQLDAALRAAGRPVGGPVIGVTDGGITLSRSARSATPTSADVWFVAYDPREQTVAIGAGENRGRDLPHRNIVRQLTRIGRWTGDAVRLNRPPLTDPAWRGAILVQATDGGRILSARRL